MSLWKSKSGGGGPRPIVVSFAGAVNQPVVGKLRLYQKDRFDIASVAMFADTVSSALTIDVKKNGVTIFPGAKPVIQAGQNIAVPVEVTATIEPTDYLTIDVVGGSASDVTIRIDPA